ncbi:hypothetical protein QC761_209950 [Podospora bellae-mahoneyi]|uniref:Uncharacterized protein n=1 Tax=Podospora bellae-mahoneyi TaxID=2093777 RepID=A0ABR0FSU0_9PEZI|nr:hypothetical protein QC761_209950 [Podospora bellae-mahoneyi]
MQRSGATPTQTAAPFFASLFGGGHHSSNSNSNSNSNSHSHSHDDPSSLSPTTRKSPGKSIRSLSRPTSSGVDAAGDTGASPARQHNVLHKSRDRRPSFGRKPSFSFASSSSPKRRANSSSSANGAARPPAIQLFPDTDNPVPPLPDYALAQAVNKLSRETDAVLSSPTSIPEGFSRMLSRTTPANGQLAPPPVLQGGSSSGQPSELSVVHQHIQETANKRISTLDYLRKAHEGRIYWFNTLLFDKPDLQRMPYFDPRKLARRATNYLLLGISLPAVIDLNSSNAVEFLKSFNTLLTEFDSFQQLHSESGASSSSLSRARIPQMFRRAAGPAKTRRSSSATTAAAAAATASLAGTAGESSLGEQQLAQLESLALTPSITNTSTTYPGVGSGTVNVTHPASIMNFAGSEIDLLPGEEYTHLLTPSLPFDPDFFETFATLCDVLIDTYTRLLGLLPSPNHCGGSVAELFSKADGKVRKLLVQGVVREFEEGTRAGVKSEVANVGKVVLSGLM